MFSDKSIREVSEQFKTDINKGISKKEAYRRLNTNGKNELKEPKRKNILQRFLGQLNDPLIYVLIIAGALSIALDEVSDAIIILFVVMLNAVVGLIQEGKAKRALDLLKKLTTPRATVIRDGIEFSVPSSELVMGDLVCLEAGNQIPADLRLIETNTLKIEESALTGESNPIEKRSSFKAKSDDIPLGDRLNMAYMSTIATYGRGKGIVVSTGMDTEIGKIASLINESKEEMTPLQKRLGELGKILSILSILLCVALFAIAVLQQRNIIDMFITAISLAVAAVPEGLPAIVTICLALSVTKMVKVNTIVRKLPSVETLGAVSVVCSDKTGTLTQNRMTVERCFVNQQYCDISELQQQKHADFIEGLVLCNDALIEKSNRIGDPTELALLDLGSKYRIDRKELEKANPRVNEKAFDSDRKMMSTLNKRNGKYVMYTKGAPDKIIQHCKKILINGAETELTQFHKQQIENCIKQMSAQALRTLAIAIKSDGSRQESVNINQRQYNSGTASIEESNMTFVGIVGMKDPARPEAARAVAKFKEAGICTVMITGDHADTALAIASQLGIADKKEQCMTGDELQKISEENLEKRLGDIRVFARVSPEHKVKIVNAFKRKGNIVAMTGDGVNDAPSLKFADIGIAMGRNGTDVAKQASDIILTDDNFATIEKAIEEGRGVYENIKKSVIFLLSSNLGEIMTMFIAVICGLASPLKSSHILWINLITDSLPALALGIDRNDADSLMKHPPRRAKESLFAHGGFACTCFYGVLISIISLVAFFTVPFMFLRENDIQVTLANIANVLSDEAMVCRAQTYAFTVLGMSQLYHAVGMRDIRKSIFKMNHVQNKLMIFACILGFLLQFAVTEIPFLVSAFGTVQLTLREWVQLSVLSSMPIFAHEIMVLCASDENSNVSKNFKVQPTTFDSI